MNVTINGTASFNCVKCGKVHAVEGQGLNFEEGASLEAESEEEACVRYSSQLDTACTACGERLAMEFEVWEYPEAVVNYAYFGQQGVANTECEFDIEYYFDDEKANKDTAEEGVSETLEHAVDRNSDKYNLADNSSDDDQVDDKNSCENLCESFNEDEQAHEASWQEGYTDQYDSEND